VLLSLANKRIQYCTQIICEILFKLKKRFIKLYQNIVFIAVFFRHRTLSRYCCHGNCADGSKPI